MVRSHHEAGCGSLGPGAERTPPARSDMFEGSGNMRETKLWHRRIGLGVLVALIGLLGFVDFLSHTDDGCEVETHCIACRVHIGPVTDLAAPKFVFSGASQILAILRAQDQHQDDAPQHLLPQGRAPPASA
jgi:hypothetical protein